MPIDLNNDKNLFVAGIRLQQLLLKKLSVEECDFVKGLLKVIERQKKSPNEKMLSELMPFIQLEIACSANKIYVEYLARVIEDIDTVVAEINALKAIKSNPPPLVNHRSGDENTYYKAEAEFNGQLMLPIQQGRDYRLRGMGGACQGYVRAWLIAFLNNEKPFGIDPDAEPLFKSINRNTKSRLEQSSDINHLMPLTDDIYRLQNVRLTAFETKLKYKDIAVKDRYLICFQKLSSDYAVADRMIRGLNASKNQSIDFGVYYADGNVWHALGVHRDKNGCIHFLDANMGWFRFKHENDFVRWMPNYLNDVYTNDRIDFDYFNITTLQLVKPTLVSELPAVLRAIARKCVSIFRGIYGIFTYNKKLNGANHPVLGENENNEPAQSTHATSYSLKLRALLDPSPIKTKSTPSRTVDALIDVPCRPNTFFAPRSDIADNTSASTLSLRK